VNLCYLVFVSELSKLRAIIPFISFTCSPEMALYCGCSEKLDVDDHYIAWRQSHDSPATEYVDGEGPFSFCSYPFLLNPRAKSKLLHTEAKFMMNHTVQQARRCAVCAYLLHF
jgi:hypothetical protein